MSWRGPNDYNDQDEWERFVMAHAMLLGSQSVYFADPTNGTNGYWHCKKCGSQAALAVPADREDNEYYYWCRCGNFGKEDAAEYHKK